MPDAMKPITTNEWKETVRDIFDLLHKRKHAAAYDLANDILTMIETRHYGYFCEGRHET